RHRPRTFVVIQRCHNKLKLNDAAMERGEATATARRRSLQRKGSRLRTHDSVSVSEDEFGLVIIRHVFFIVCRSLSPRGSSVIGFPWAKSARTSSANTARA